MIAVMVDAKVPGSSSWVAVRHAKKIRVSGVIESILRLEVFGESINHSDLVGEGPNLQDGEYVIPSGVERVKAILDEVGDGERVFVDLE